jgi:outer membrane protein W
MTPPSVSARARRAAVVVGALLSVAAPVRSASGQSQGNGFLFQVPKGALTVRLGMSNPSARSDLFEFATDSLTLNRSDFAALAVAAEFSFTTAVPQLDVALGVGYAGSRAPSEFRNWVDTDDRPIEQTTTFRRVPVTASLKAYLTPRGREVGHFAWVPARVSPYVGAGLGMMWYSFRQEGDFVDFETLDVFTSQVESSGWGPMAQGLAGVDVTVSPRVALTADARYVRSNANVMGDFEGFERLDLSGLTTSLGFNFRF